RARDTATSTWMSRLARFGYATKGVVYLIIGGLAVQLAIGHGGSATDQHGALQTIYDQPFGKFLLAIVALGLLGFALWCFIPLIIRGIAQLYANALKNIERFLYLENQYFRLRTYSGLDLPFLGSDNAEMEQNIRLLGEALQRGASLSIILPDHPNVGRAFSDAALIRLRAQAPQAVEEGRLQAFCLATSVSIEGGEHYRPIYVHAKIALVDDIWATVGSANLNNRGMRDDTEMNVATLDADLAQGLRLMLQAEHLGLLQEDDLFTLSRGLGNQQQTVAEQKRAMGILHSLQEQLSDPIVALRLMQERAWENLRLYKARQPLLGNLLPYLTADEASQHGLNFRQDHGWLEEP
ncbi:MAG TPA: DUF1206 domain-containing protein, partial [Ktedonosporobacter sp.]|nr:DUF1206 domain-containing protein [Ktedonosporobacter sp.]